MAQTYENRKPVMDKDKRKVLNLLEYISERYPSLRVCQIIGNAIPMVGDHYYVTDKEMVGYLEEYIIKVEGTEGVLTFVAD